MTVRLHPLLFGQRARVRTNSLRQMQEQVERVLGWNAEYDAIGEAGAFATQQSSTIVNNMRITALAHTPIRTRVQSDALTFFMPIDGGSIRSQVNGDAVTSAPRETALLAPAGERIGTGDGRSLLMISLDPSVMEQTARAMVRDWSGSLNLQRPLIMPLVTGGVNFDLILRNASMALDASLAQGGLTAAMAYDDIFYRAICAMLLRDRLFAEPSRSPTASTHELERACEFIVANLHGRIAMTDLEKISGLSVRSLQYAFQKRFGQSPLLWIRNERLNAARAMLAAPEEDTTVTHVALTFGFSNVGDFSKFYRQRFGELPSRTLAAARSKA
ncbi:helix-turn-helix transcriptional regulator [Rhizobiales bacterium Sp-1]|uniref:Helix-turn-helix transcriptional regulator n=2 Tax=Segnochrobactrum spirostomi TaxID=2608987 RepID=A0A6A7Y335_9HYPH|nr:helix-turn-helix transcriptional regulator [Segnochrobactrum spirostomi]